MILMKEVIAMIRFAVLGPGNISHRFIKGCNEYKNAEATAFASRTPAKVADYAASVHVEKVYTYEDLYKDKEIDAVYISTPPFVHFQQIKACLNAGKHVLCEKPLCETVEQAKELFALAQEKHLVLMEAQKAVFLPVHTRIKEWLASGEFGTIYAADASFCRNHAASLPKDHWVYTMPCCGAMYDVGVYPLSVLLSLFPEPLKTVSRTDIFEDHCPVSSIVSMATEDNILLTARASITYEMDNELKIYAQNGTITSRDFWHSHTAEYELNGIKKSFNDIFESEFSFEIQHFCSLIENGCHFSPIMSPEFSMKVLKIVSEQSAY